MLLEQAHRLGDARRAEVGHVEPDDDAALVAQVDPLLERPRVALAGRRSELRPEPEAQGAGREARLRVGRVHEQDPADAGHLTHRVERGREEPEGNGGIVGEAGDAVCRVVRQHHQGWSHNAAT